jgi:hypothetical protein
MTTVTFAIRDCLSHQNGAIFRQDFPKTFCSQVDYSKKRPHVPGCFALAAASIDY